MKENQIAGFFKGIGNAFGLIGTAFSKGDWKTKLSFIIMGFGSIMRKQFARGIAFLAVEILYIWYIVSFGASYLVKFGSLGTVATHEEPAYFNGIEIGKTTVFGDNSFLILLFSVMTLFITVLFIIIWYINVKNNYESQLKLEAGKELPSNKQDLSSLLDHNFDKTLLSIPVLGVFMFVVVPIVFMILVAFTNYDATHQPPTNLFTWVGFENFKNLLSIGGSGFGSTFFTILIWTLVWAFFATFLNYFGGMAVAILINKKGIKFKKLWRTILVMTIAVPQFVSLLYIGKMFAKDGLINGYLMKWGWIDSAIPFWTDPLLAKITIIIINVWVGIPYVMLITTGLLMNIPEDLYESARIDGANPFQMFMKITLPYMLFVTGPYLLTSFTGNLNNFNVIYLLTTGSPLSTELTGGAGRTDLLITWLYKLTVNDTNYRMAAVIDIMVFVVTAVISLVVYNILPSVKDEEGFQ